MCAKIIKNARKKTDFFVKINRKQRKILYRNLVLWYNKLIRYAGGSLGLCTKKVQNENKHGGKDYEEIHEELEAHIGAGVDRCPDWEFG